MIATYVNLTTFTVVGDKTDTFLPGVNVRCDCGTDGYAYGTVVNRSYISPNTEVVISGDALTSNLVEAVHGYSEPKSIATHGHSNLGDGGVVAHSSLSGIGSNTHTQIDSHLANVSNPHAVTAAQAGGVSILASSATIYVATTGSDSTGTGSESYPFASIAKAMTSLADKRIAPGALVTIQVAHGTYAISSTITINHPDADKIQILGDATAETTVAISAVNASAKTITVAGDYTGSILAGDMVVITGSSTSGLNGAYKTSGVAYSGGNTVLTCSAETFASSTVGGGSLIIKPCNRVILNCASGVTCFTMSKTIYQIAGFRFVGQGSGRAAYCAYSKTTFGKCIVESFDIGLEFDMISVFNCGSVAVKSCASYGLLCWYASVAKFYNKIFFDSCGCGVTAVSGASVYLDSGQGVFRNNTTDCYPAANTVGNVGACVYIS